MDQVNPVHTEKRPHSDAVKAAAWRRTISGVRRQPPKEAPWARPAPLTTVERSKVETSRIQAVVYDPVQLARERRAAEEAARPLALRIAKRTLTLGSDAIVLTIASPFFLAWWIYKGAKRLASALYTRDLPEASTDPEI